MGNITLALIEYSESGAVPELSPIADIVFTTFKQTIDRDTEKWENVCQKNAENGRKGGRPKKASGNYEIPKKPNGSLKNPEEPKKADNDKEYDNEYDNEVITPSKGVEEEGFNEFWQAYPKKTAKQAALKAWKKLKPDSELLKIILNALEQQKQSVQWQKEGGQFIPYPATWLNGRRWEDIQEQISQPAPPKYEYDPNDPYANWN